MLRESLQRWIGSLVTGEVTLGCGAATTTRSSTPTGPNFSYHPDKLSMESVETPPSARLDRIGQLTMRNLDIDDSRAKLELYAGQPLDQGPVLVENGTLFGELPERRLRPDRRQPGAEGDDDDRALDDAAMEFGTD